MVLTRFHGQPDLPPLAVAPGHELRAPQHSDKHAATGTLPDFALIEPDIASGHNDYHHPAYGRSSIGADVDIDFDPPSSLLGGEAFLELRAPLPSELEDRTQSSPLNSSSRSRGRSAGIFSLGWNRAARGAAYSPP